MRAQALAVLVAAALLAAPGLALGKGEDKNPASSPATPPVSSAAFMDEALVLCTQAALHGGKAVSDGSFPGWTAAEDDGDNGPFYEVFSFEKTIDGLEDVTLWGTIEHYPGKVMGYCRFNASDAEGHLLDFADLAARPQLTGSTQDADSGHYGAWTVKAEGDAQAYAIAQLVDGDFQLEINTLTDAAPTEPAASPEPAKTEE